MAARMAASLTPPRQAWAASSCAAASEASTRTVSASRKPAKSAAASLAASALVESTQKTVEALPTCGRWPLSRSWP